MKAFTMNYSFPYKSLLDLHETLNRLISLQRKTSTFRTAIKVLSGDYCDPNRRMLFSTNQDLSIPPS